MQRKDKSLPYMVATFWYITMSLVSIVIPVYNVENYLVECLESVKNQTLKDIEIICVDDGSTDSSAAILDDYAKSDDRFVVIHKPNEGYGKTVNVGMDRASSPYVAILESDDYVSADMYSELYELIKRENVDVVKCDFYEFYQGQNGNYVEEYRSLMTEEKYIGLYEQPINVSEHEDAMRYTKFTWSGIYRLDFLREQGIRHNETPGASYQDNGFWFQTMVLAKNVYFLKKAFYHYRIDNPNSSMYSTAKVYAVCDEFDFVNKILDTLGEKGKQFYRWSYYRRITDCILNINRVDEKYKLALAKKTAEDLLKGLQDGHIDANLFGTWWGQRLFRLLSNPQLVIDEEESRINKVVNATKDYDSIILYGAGLIGERVQKALRVGRENRKIIAYAVSNIDNNPDEVLGVPVKSISDLNEYRKEALVIISVGKKFRDEVEENVKKAGFIHYIYATDIL